MLDFESTHVKCSVVALRQSLSKLKAEVWLSIEVVVKLYAKQR